MIRSPLLTLLLLIISFAAIAEDTPDGAARDFMSAYRQLGPGIALHKIVEKHVSSGFLFQLRALEAAEKIAGQCEPGPGIYEGDLLTSYAESAERFNVLSCGVRGITARCLVALEVGSAKDGLRWKDTLILVVERGHWRVSDVDRFKRLPRLASAEIADMICGVAASCPDAKWPEPLFHRHCAIGRADR